LPIGQGLSWSPRGDRIAFYGSFGGEAGIYTIKPDGTGLQQITDAHRFDPDFSPGAAKLVATRWDGTQTDVVVMDADGNNETELADSAANDENPAWSPDGTKIAFHSDRAPSGVYTMIVSPRSFTSFLTPGFVPDWQPIPINGYPRPRAASPVHASLVPAYQECTVPGHNHGPPLAFPSCYPPQRIPSALTVGTPDANGEAAKSVGHVRVGVKVGHPTTPADEADVRLRSRITDVRNASDLSDYTGDLTIRLSVQITDKNNTPHPGGPGAATVQQFTHSHPLPCAATADTTVGATCQFDTTVDALVPGAVAEGRRAIWELGQVRVDDADGNAFLKQGIFIP
jgi:WD40-like Beta Propeller Repeat